MSPKIPEKTYSLTPAEFNTLEKAMSEKSMFSINRKTADLASRFAFHGCDGGKAVTEESKTTVMGNIKEKIEDGLKWGSLRKSASALWNLCSGGGGGGS
ncbi:MAG: hypothetical protein V4489_09415, partial [Chlamydiota bacterium]